MKIREVFKALDQAFDATALFLIVTLTWVLGLGLLCVGVGMKDGMAMTLHGFLCKCSDDESL